MVKGNTSPLIMQECGRYFTFMIILCDFYFMVILQSEAKIYEHLPTSRVRIKMIYCAAVESFPLSFVDPFYF